METVLTNSEYWSWSWNELDFFYLLTVARFAMLSSQDIRFGKNNIELMTKYFSQIALILSVESARKKLMMYWVEGIPKNLEVVVTCIIQR